MAYRNANVQTRSSTDQPWYWDVRPFGNPHPTLCYDVSDFYYENKVFSADGLTKSTETIWANKQAFLNTLPPDVYEQPQFQQWHDENGMTFSVVEDENFEHDPSRIGDIRVIQE